MISSRTNRRRRRIVILSVFWALAGCQSIAYYGQAVRGQMTLLNARRPVSELLADPQTPPALRAGLQRAAALLGFAERALDLPAAGQYRSYVALERPYAAWIVVAAGEFSLSPKTWCYPVAGCAAYRGYFDRERALAEAKRLAARGYDVAVGGVAAYSTLGWFEDPLLSTFLALPEAQLAELIFHELAHQELYVPGDTAFNEGFATAVAREGLRRWFEAGGQPAAARRQARMEALEGQALALIDHYRRRLAALYESGLPAERMRQQKRAVFEALRQDFEDRRRQQPELASFEAWFAPPLNNARLAGIGSYHQRLPAFRRLLERGDRDLARFYSACRRLAALPAERRAAALDQLSIR